MKGNTVTLTHRQTVVTIAALHHAADCEHDDAWWDRDALMEAIETFLNLPHHRRVRL